MDRMKMKTSNLADSNFAALSEMFPNAVTETVDENGAVVRAIDADILAQEINTRVISGKEERYQFTWPDKKKSVLLANAPIAATLRPCREESVDFDNTENLYIEGDNLDILKLLRETYLNRVKMIYIDPPYNTGKDFIYEDDFSENVGEFMTRDGQYDDEGNRMVKNLDSNGRFHTDWLNMIYPRLRMARDLLTDDGVIFISIDDNEVENLKKVCNEVFGESNFICSMIWQKKTGASDAVTIATITEYIHVYCKNISEVRFTKNSESFNLNRYRYQDDYASERGPYYIDNLDRGGLQYSDSLNYGIECPDGTITFPNGRTEFVNDGWIWKWSNAKIEWARTNHFIEFRQSTSKQSGWAVCYKNYLKVDNENKPIERAAPHKNLVLDVMNANAAAVMKDLFNTNNYFDYSKPLDLIKKFISLVQMKNGDLVLDFFSGSATTAHAVMQLNTEDGANRKFIMVQLPEICQKDSEASKAGYNNICEIGKERIRRAGKKIKEENKDKEGIENLDIGFRVLKLDSSNMKDVYYTPEGYAQMNFNIEGFMDNIKLDRSDEDLLFQVMLDFGIPLSAKIRQEGKIFYVNDNYLIACFCRVDTALITELAKKQPYYAVFRDSSFQSDSALVNFEQVFNTYSPKTIRRVL